VKRINCRQPSPRILAIQLTADFFSEVAPCVNARPVLRPQFASVTRDADLQRKKKIILVTSLTAARRGILAQLTILFTATYLHLYSSFFLIIHGCEPELEEYPFPILRTGDFPQ
jgi:hypothetical protein